MYYQCRHPAVTILQKSHVPLYTSNARVTATRKVLKINVVFYALTKLYIRINNSVCIIVKIPEPLSHTLKHYETVCSQMKLGDLR